MVPLRPLSPWATTEGQVAIQQGVPRDPSGARTPNYHIYSQVHFGPSSVIEANAHFTHNLSRKTKGHITNSLELYEAG